MQQQLLYVNKESDYTFLALYETIKQSRKDK